jgi:hypothetical protein
MVEKLEISLKIKCGDKYYKLSEWNTGIGNCSKVVYWLNNNADEGMEISAEKMYKLLHEYFVKEY